MHKIICPKIANKVFEMIQRLLYIIKIRYGAKLTALKKEVRPFHSTDGRRKMCEKKKKDIIIKIGLNDSRFIQSNFEKLNDGTQCLRKFHIHWNWIEWNGIELVVGTEVWVTLYIVYKCIAYNVLEAKTMIMTHK